MPTIRGAKTETSRMQHTIPFATTAPHKSDTVIRILSLFLLSLPLILLFFPETSRAARTINLATLDALSSVTVAPNATITAVVTVTTDGSGSSSRWRSTGWGIATSPGTITCVNHTNHDSAGTNSETFNIAAPATVGTYNAYFIAYNDDGCSSGASTTDTINSGVIVNNTPPTVSSINRINPTPTASTNVSWTVTFSKNDVTGVDATDFTLIQGGGVNGATITSVAGGGGTWTVSASTGSGNGTLGLNLVDNDSIIDTAGNPLGGSGSGNGNFTGQVYTVDKNCFTDNFDGTLSPNWSVGRQGGTYTPQIIGSRLRLTDASAAAATWATLQRIFPAAGNKVTAEFDHYAYGGTGADGIAVILSNAAIPPVAGAFGGSMGYAQKGQSPVSDCTATGGCPGFAGGWLGIALDEYGNFSTNTEGRVGGFTATVPNSVALRGSGSGMSGYRYLIGTGSLTPAINTTSTSFDHYRITVDHTDDVHAWVSVERDPAGGTNFTTLLGCAPGQTSGCTALDVLDAGYSQDPIPADWFFSFTGTNGSLTNIHELDSLRVCTSQGQTVPTLDHIRLIHNGQACTGSSNPAAITVKACADATCSSLYLGSVTVNLTSTGIAGATWSSNPVTFTGGQTTVTLTSTITGTTTLGATTSPPTGNATDCLGGSPTPCSLTFGSCVFDVVETGASAFTPIYTKVSGTAFNLDVLSLSGGSQTVSKVEIVDASSGTCSTYASLANSTTTVPSTFTANQRKTFGFNYGKAARNARIRVITATNQSCSSDNFAIRPTAFAVTSTATQTGSTGTPVFRASQDTFSLTATALPGYDGMPKLNAALASSALPNIGLFGAVTFPNANATNGVATATSFTYSEVGNFSLGQYAVYDDGFTAVDANKTPPECTSDFNNGPMVNGRYGCMFGSPSPPAGPFGRFVPHHFTVVGAVANACAAGNSTYMGQPFSLSRFGDTSKAEVVEARNAGEVVTKNYAGAYAPGAVSFGAENADNGTDLSARLAFYSAGTYPALSGSWISGVYTLTGNNTVVAFQRPSSSPDGPFDSLDLGLTVADSDVTTSPKVSGADMNPSVAGGTNFTYKKFSGSPLRMRFGRLVLQNAYGPETEIIKMRLLVQYYNGTSFITNPDDTCSKYNATAIAPAPNPLTCADPNLTDSLTCADVTASGVNVGNGQYFTLSAPHKIGYLLYTLAVDPWMQYEWSGPIDYKDNPTGRANFGIYRGNDRIINWREISR